MISYFAIHCYFSLFHNSSSGRLCLWRSLIDLICKEKVAECVIRLIEQTFSFPRISCSTCVSTCCTALYNLSSISSSLSGFNYNPNPSTHSCTSDSSTPERNTIPSCQSPVPARSAKIPLSPIPEEEEVRGRDYCLSCKIIILYKRIHRPCSDSHQIGYPMNTV